MKAVQYLGYGATALIVILSCVIFISSRHTEQEIEDFQNRIVDIAASTPSHQQTPRPATDLPEPVQRYFDFVFTSQVPSYNVVRLEAQGDFRRPQTESFNPTTAEQVIAISTPALMFSATTPVLPGVWARAYDFYANGNMEMRAKIMSTLTVLDQSETPELNRISLRRWLLESALYPQALLPGGPVTWEAISDNSARAVVNADGVTASMVAHFDEQGRMTHMQAEEAGDLNTPYHGSGEHVARGDYQSVGGQMIPMSFTISRAAAGKLYPFWDGNITTISFE